MKSEQEDRVTVDQLQSAFSMLAVEKVTLGIFMAKKFITKQDLLTVGITPETVAFLTSKMTAMDNGYDFDSFLKQSFC